MFDFMYFTSAFMSQIYKHLTLWCPLFPRGYSYKAYVVHVALTFLSAAVDIVVVLCNFTDIVCLSSSGDDMKVMENDTDWQFVTIGDQVDGSTLLSLTQLLLISQCWYWLASCLCESHLIDPVPCREFFTGVFFYLPLLAVSVTTKTWYSLSDGNLIT